MRKVRLGLCEAGSIQHGTLGLRLAGGGTKGWAETQRQKSSDDGNLFSSKSSSSEKITLKKAEKGRK